MPKVKFLQDFQGVETREVFYQKGQVVNIPDDLIDRLVNDKRVELLKPDARLDVEPQFENAYYGSQPETELKNDEEIHSVIRKRVRK